MQFKALTPLSTGNLNPEKKNFSKKTQFLLNKNLIFANFASLHVFKIFTTIKFRDFAKTCEIRKI